MQVVGGDAGLPPGKGLCHSMPPAYFNHSVIPVQTGIRIIVFSRLDRESMGLWILTYMCMTWGYFACFAGQLYRGCHRFRNGSVPSPHSDPRP